MHGIYRPAGRRGRDDGKQAAGQHAKACFFTLHVDATVRARRQQMWISLNFRPHHYRYADHKMNDIAHSSARP